MATSEVDPQYIDTFTENSECELGKNDLEIQSLHSLDNKSINTVQYKNLMNSLSEMQIKLDKFTKVVDGLDGTLTSNKKETEKEINQLKNTIENLSNKNYNSDNVSNFVPSDRKSVV